MKSILKKSRNLGLALALGVAALAGIPDMASAQAASPPIPAQPQAQVQQLPAGTYAAYPGYYGPGYCYYGPGYMAPQAYTPQGYAPGYGGWGCGWY